MRGRSSAVDIFSSDAWNVYPSNAPARCYVRKNCCCTIFLMQFVPLHIFRIERHPKCGWVTCQYCNNGNTITIAIILWCTGCNAIFSLNRVDSLGQHGRNHLDFIDRHQWTMKYPVQLSLHAYSIRPHIFSVQFSVKMMPLYTYVCR